MRKFLHGALIGLAFSVGTYGTIALAMSGRFLAAAIVATVFISALTGWFHWVLSRK